MMDEVHIDGCSCHFCEKQRLKAKEGMPIGFQFPISKLASWQECVDALREQGFHITKT